MGQRGITTSRPARGAMSNELCKGCEIYQLNCVDCKSEKVSNSLSNIESHPQFENFIRAFWRRIYMHRNDFGKELPDEMPVQFRASMAIAFLTFTSRRQ